MDVLVVVAAEDRERMLPLLDALRAEGLDANFGENAAEASVLVPILSARFLESKEILRVVDEAMSRKPIVPLLLDHAPEILDALPLPFRDTVYARADSNLQELARTIAEVVHGSDDDARWKRKARQEIAASRFAAALTYTGLAVRLAPGDYEAQLLHVRSLAEVDPRRLRSYLVAHDFDWIAIKKNNADADLVRDAAAKLILLDPDDSALASSVFWFLLDAPGAWRTFIQLFERPSFATHRNLIAGSIVAHGRAETAPWVLEMITRTWDDETMSTLAVALAPIAMHVPEHRERALQIARDLLRSDNEDLRLGALFALYHGAPDGSRIAVDALRDRAWLVRMTAFDLLSGTNRRIFKADWSVEDGPERPRDPLLTDDEITRLLQDPEEEVGQQVFAWLTRSGIQVPPPKITGPPREVRLVKVQRLAAQGAIDDLIRVAREDPSDLVRSEAAQALRDSHESLAAKDLRTLYLEENVRNSRRAIIDLLIEKADATLDDLLLDVIRKQWWDEHVANRALKKLIALRSPLVEEARAYLPHAPRA